MFERVEKSDVATAGFPALISSTFGWLLMPQVSIAVIMMCLNLAGSVLALASKRIIEQFIDEWIERRRKRKQPSAPTEDK